MLSLVNRATEKQQVEMHVFKKVVGREELETLRVVMVLKNHYAVLHFTL